MFISKGFTCWKEGPKAFKKYHESECHREECTYDVDELHSEEHEAEMAKNCEMLRRWQ